MSKEKVLLIVNPISGSTSKSDIPRLAKEKIDRSRFDVEIKFTDYRGHAIEVTETAVKEGFDVVVAVGGDGTVNEVGRKLLNTDTRIAIIPKGSGNGLVRHLGIPLDTEKAIELINSGRSVCIDAATINDIPFFCTSGVGFDAHIGNIFVLKARRGFFTYFNTVIREFFRYKPEEYAIEVNGQKITQKAFLVTFANAAQWGNNAYIAPQADLFDGKLDLAVMKPLSVLSAIFTGVKLFTRGADRSSSIDYYQSEEIILKRAKPGVIHLDGEPAEMDNLLRVKTMPQCLKVVV